MAAHPWPDIPDEQRWSLELMEERLERTSQPPRELSARAEELRAQAAQTDIEGYRDAALAWLIATSRRPPFASPRRSSTAPASSAAGGDFALAVQQRLNLGLDELQLCLDLPERFLRPFGIEKACSAHLPES